MTADSRAPGQTPVELRIGSALPFPAPTAGALIALTLIALFLGAHLLFAVPIVDHGSRSALPIAAGAHVALVISVMLGYLLAAGRLTSAAVARELGTIGLAPPEANLARSRWAGAAGVLFGIVTVAVTTMPGRGTTSLGKPGVAVMIAVAWLAMCWILGRAAYFTLRGVGFAADRSGHGPELDLLDLGRLDVFGRLGLRYSLAWIAGISLCLFLYLFDPNPQDVEPFLGLWGLLMLGIVAVASLALLIPVRGVRRAIRTAKRAELAAIDGRLRGLRDAAMQHEANHEGRLADLLAYRGHVESLREWPFDTRTLSRFGLYLLIPIGSWFGGAFVELLVDALVD